MKIYDVSVPLHVGMVVWPGDPGFMLESISSIAEGQRANVSRISCSSHTGTHVDAPFHFIAQGRTLDLIELNQLAGAAVVVEISGDDDITAEDLDIAEAMGDLPKGTVRVLFKTSNTLRKLMRSAEFHRDYVAVSPGAARWLVERGYRTVGVDYLSVERFHPPEPETHPILLGADVFVIEGLDLADVPPGNYTLVCAPLKLVGGDGSPARVFLLQE